MTKFRVRHAPPFEDTEEGDVISSKYFTVDTADHDLIDSWIKKNPHYLTYVYDGGRLVGFIGILPLTLEAGLMFDRQELLEEDITAEMVLSPEVMRYAQYLYITAIAVDDLHRFRGKKAAAALVSCGAGMIRNLYSGGHLKRVYANPTTFWGNRIIGRFGLRPMSSFKKLLRAGNDPYVVEANDAFWTQMEYLERRYQRFLTDYPWPL